MNKEEYRELLKDGRWQRKRLEIMQRDDFKCTKCGTTNDLNVHHLRYIDGRKPWEYEDADLVTLCRDCHKATHEEMERKQQDADEYCERVSRAEYFSGLFLYYEHIGCYQDVIVMYHAGYVMEMDMFYFIIPFFYHDTPLYVTKYDGNEWMFSDNGFNIILDKDKCSELRDHIWRTELLPTVLTVEQFKYVQRGLNYETDDHDIMFIREHYMEESIERYAEMEREENARKELIRKTEQEKLQRLANESQRETATTPKIILPKMSLSWNDIRNRH